MKKKYLLLAICLTAMASGVTETVLGSAVAKNNSQSTRIDKSKFFNILVTQNSNDAEAFFNQGNANVDSEDYQEAIADFTKAIKINPTYKDAYYWRAYVYRKLKNYQAGIADYTKLISLNPDSRLFYYYDRGNAYRELKNYQAAIADYTKAMKINPNDADAYFNRGIAYSELRDYETAASDVLKAAQLYQRQGNTNGHKQMQQVFKLLELEDTITK